jgi:phage tail-like protein
MGTPTNYWKKFSFVVEIDGVARAEFITCSELRINAETVTFREGGRLNSHKAPGLVEFPAITLTRGTCDDLDLYQWMRDTFDAAAGTGMIPPDLYRTLDLVQKTRDGEEVERYTLFNVWCKEYSAGDWDNNANEVRVETVVLECEYWKRGAA